MTIDKNSDNTQILKEIGSRIKTNRIRQELTQADLANYTGLSKGTIENIENGKSVQLSSLIAILRELDCLGSLDLLLPNTEHTPMELIKDNAPGLRYRYKKSKTVKKKEDWVWED